MNYRHGYHAGNFADVFKHAVLARVLYHLTAKEAPFRAIDTHSGAGSYDLAGKQAQATNESREGIARLFDHLPKGAALELLAPYLDTVRKTQPRYPGSPLLIQVLSRPQDRLIFCELHPEEFASLTKSLGRDRRIKTMEMDGWQALKSLLPPQERRGLILIDPPYEDDTEFRTAAESMAEAVRRFATGVYLVWYPIKNRHDTGAAVRRIIRAAGKPALQLEIEVAPARADGPLTACGLLAVNPPWKLKEECEILLPTLVKALAGKNRGAVRIESAE